MSRPEHRILPRHREQHPFHRPHHLGALLFLGLFALVSIPLLGSRFALDGPTGQAQLAATSVNITNSTPFTCDVALRPGTNLVSLPCLPVYIYWHDILGNFSRNGTTIAAVYDHVPSSPGGWRVYNASLPNYTVSSLSTVGRNDGLYLVMAADETFLYGGYLGASPSVPLVEGWNLVGYPTTYNESILTVLASIEDSYQEIRTVNGTEETGGYLSDLPPPGGDTLLETRIYEGYWILTNASGSWEVGP